VGDHHVAVERVTGIEPASSTWEADVLPLNYTRNHRFENDINGHTAVHSGCGSHRSKRFQPELANMDGFGQLLVSAFLDVGRFLNIIGTAVCESKPQTPHSQVMKATREVIGAVINI
jgi:hypothetical protein